jgi:glutaryl-CoA dehydrogenase
MSPPAPLDFLDLDRLLSDEERLIRDTTRGLVTDRILPEVAGWFERAELPRALAKDLGDLGLLGMHLDGYGCAGTNAVSYGLACLELEAGDSGARSFVSVQGSLAMYPIWKFGSEDQKRRWLPPMAAGEVIGCFGLTEPDFGSNPAGMRTSARREGASSACAPRSPPSWCWRTAACPATPCCPRSGACAARCRA